MNNAEYMKVKYKHFPQDIKEKYNLRDRVKPDDYVYIKRKKGIYGLKQAAILAYDHLRNSLEPYGYYPIKGTVSVWEHETQPTKNRVFVDDFGVKY